MTRVLVVDDDVTAVKGLRRLLQMDGYEVDSAESSEQAIAKLSAGRYDAVITDLEMPEVHGVEVVRAALARRADMPVFVMTGYHGTPASDAALAAGALRVFGKPLHYDALLAELSRSLAP